MTMCIIVKVHMNEHNERMLVRHKTIFDDAISHTKTYRDVQRKKSEAIIHFTCLYSDIIMLSHIKPLSLIVCLLWSVATTAATTNATTNATTTTAETTTITTQFHVFAIE